MRQRLAIFVTVAVVLVLLAALNTASYVGVEGEPDREFNPDRSTYNAGATGTRALFDLLSETGHVVMRWQEPPAALMSERNTPVSTFVVVGRTRVAFSDEEAKELLLWVETGGRLVLIDRRPDPALLPASGDWSVSAKLGTLPGPATRPNEPEEMTAGVALVRASLPSGLTRNVDSVMPSRFASTVNIVRAGAQGSATPTPKPTPQGGGEDYEGDDYGEAEPPPPPVALPPSVPPPPEARPRPGDDDDEDSEWGEPSPAPVAHLEDHNGALLVDYSYGAGRIILLSDPYLVSNGGLRLADNLQLAVNVAAGDGGVIAFDEYHQGRGATRNPFIAYFSGTPVLWLLAQGALVVLAFLWTRGRRFARPLPVAGVDRRSSLEFVASMAELQQRARAYDLALENIYTRLRRVLVRYAGLGHNSSRAQVAARVAARSGKLRAADLEALMRECEDAINGEPLDSVRALALVGRLRGVERALGLGTRSREARQAAEGLQQTTL